MSNGLHSQQLVPNPGFEEVIACPDAFSQLDRTASWTTPALEATPDYFHVCGTGFVGVPENIDGYEEPVDGSAYVGIFLYWNAPAFIDAREYIQAELLEPLLAGTCYTLTFHVSLSEGSALQTDDIGAHFHTSAISGIPGFPVLPLPIHVSNPEGVFFGTEGWHVITGEYIAQGGEDHLLIGNFKNDSSTTVVGPLAGYAYSYVDDVQLRPCHSTGLGSLDDPLDFIGAEAFNDPDFWSAVEEAHGLLRIVNMQGQVVYQGAPRRGNLPDIATYGSGLYVIVLALPGNVRSWRVVLNDH